MSKNLSFCLLTAGEIKIESSLLDMGVKTLKIVIIFIQKSRKSEFSKILAELFEKKAEFPAKTEFISDLSFCPKSEKKSLD